MSKGPKTLTSNTSQTTQIDPTLAARQNQVWNRAQGVANTPYQAYTGQRNADFTPDQLSAFDMARNAAGAGQTELNQAVEGTQGLSGFQAPTIGYTGAAGATAAAPGAVTAGQINPLAMGNPLTARSVSARDVTARSGAAGYEGYMNPFTNEVVNTSLGDIERARLEAENATNLSGAAAGAFGGSRSGVANALTNRDFGNLAASTAAGLRKSGFETALGYNAGDQNRELAAGQSNQAADIASGTANAANDLNAQAGNRNNLLQIAMANQSTGLDASKFNAGIEAGTNQFNAGQLQQGNQFNASGQLAADSANAGNAIGSAGVRGNALAQLAGLAGQRQSMGATGADLLSRVGGAQQGLDQANKDFAFSEFDAARKQPAANVDLLSRILGGQQYGSTTTGTSTQPNPNRGGLFSTLAGLGGVALGGPLGGILGKKLGGLFGGGSAPGAGVEGVYG